MNLDDFNFFDDNNGFDFKPSFPLFNFEVLREIPNEDSPLNLFNTQKVSEIVEDILHKKVIVEDTQVTLKKRGRKAIPKDAKKWDDPTITIQEIIENDLAGTPMQSEIKMKEEKLKKMREKKALKKAGATVETNKKNEETVGVTLALEPLFDTKVSFAPQIVIKDGKIVVETLRDEPEKKLLVVENQKPFKLTSMSFRQKNQTAKWTVEETRKFFKAIEIFGADFSLIAKLFPTRNRDQIKNKFRKEEKVNLFKMDEAFKKNSVLSKRSLMDRIRNFNDYVNAGDFDKVPQLKKIYSNTSTDSMDMKIMEEIQDIFVKEIKPRGPLAIMGNAVVEENDSDEDFVDKVFVKRAESIVVNNNSGMTGDFLMNANQETVPKKQNLFMKLLI